MRAQLFPFVLLLMVGASAPLAFGWTPEGVYLARVEPEPTEMVYPDFTVPGLAADGEGGAFVVWPTFGGYGPLPLTVLKMTRITASGALDPQWPAGGLSLRSPVSIMDYPHAVADGTGGAFVLWTQQQDGSPGNVGIQRVTATGAIAPGWPADGRSISGVATADGGTLVADGAGGFYVAWAASLPYPSSDYEIRALHFQGDGAPDPAWPADGVLLDPAAWGPTPSAAVSGGQLFVTWTKISLTLDIAVQSLTPFGTPASGWPADGITINPAGDQIRSVCIADGAGGVYLAWRDARTITDQVYLQHLAANGVRVPGWSVFGRIAGDATTSVGVSPTLSLGSDGGVFLAWVRPSGALWLQRVQSGGATAPSWPVAGLGTGLTGEWAENAIGHALVADASGGAFLVGRASGLVASHFLQDSTSPPPWPIALGTPKGETGPAMIPDGRGAALVAWYDFRDILDVYADRLLPDGSQPTDVGKSLEAGTLVAWPNPSVGEVRFLFRSDATSPDRLEVFDVAGRLVRVVAIRATAAPQVLTWEGCDFAGRPVASGTYFARVAGLRGGAPIKIVIASRGR